MTEQIISPGVFLNENDQSLVQRGIQTIGAALVGPTVRGNPLIPTLVTSYSEYLSNFGSIFKSGSYYYEYFTSTAAQQYFQSGGQSLLVTRVISGSSNIDSYASSSIASISGSASFGLETLSWGNIMNNSGSEISGALALGTIDNVRWEIVNVNTGSGNFTINIRRGDDNNSTKNIIETWANVCLDPQLPNFISRVIGDQKPTYTIDDDGVAYVSTIGSYANNSSKVRIKNVTSLVNSIDNNGIFNPAFAHSLPQVGTSGSFSGGVAATNLVGLYNENITDNNNQGFIPADYQLAIDLLTNKDEYQFNLLIVPGVTLTNSAVNDVIATVENRGDALAVVDNGLFGTAITTATQNAASQNSNYGATYYPWVQVFSSDLAKSVWVPPSVVMGGVFAFNDQVGQQFFAPAGLNRGGIPNVLKAERKLSQNDRDKLYPANVNPLATFPGEGVVAWGQKTLQRKATALDRINVRRLLIQLKGYLGQLARNMTFEQNTNATRIKFLSQANPYMDAVVQKQGLYAYQIDMDSSNNTSDVIDRNQLVGTIQIQPTKTAEFIILNFNISPTGSSFQ